MEIFCLASLSRASFSPPDTYHASREGETMDVGIEQKKVNFVKFQYL